MSEDLNNLPTKGWSCRKVRKTVTDYLKTNPDATAVMISRDTRCPLFAVERWIAALTRAGLIKRDV